MEPERHHLTVRRMCGQEERSVVVTVVKARYEDGTYWILAIEGHPTWMAKSRRLSHALHELMTLLEVQGWFLLCNYSRVDVASFNRTAILRDGRYGWILSLTKRFDHQSGEQVLLLAPLSENLDPATLAEKERFRARWREFNGT